jgi:polyisoprenoid-binding protein YceI
MQEHFNENYLESSKYPLATFKGKIIDIVDFSKNGSYDITAKGFLTIHGVTQPKELKGKLTIDNAKINLKSNFEVKVTDFKIEVPTLVFAKIAEIIAVKSLYNFSPFIKK